MLWKDENHENNMTALYDVKKAFSWKSTTTKF